ncbi:MAG: hypothetical protein Q9207_000180 [Kuettlingeria erythrocarpa]
MSVPIPVILCGRAAYVARSVIAGLQPEYEAGKSEIPSLLRGDGPPVEVAKNLGTKNYSKTPAAVLLGAGYQDADIAAMREACRDESRVPWLRPDLSKPSPPLGPEYGKAVVQRVKSRLEELRRDGKINADGVYFF